MNPNALTDAHLGRKIKLDDVVLKMSFEGYVIRDGGDGYAWIRSDNNDPQDRGSLHLFIDDDEIEVIA